MQKNITFPKMAQSLQEFNERLISLNERLPFSLDFGPMEKLEKIV